MKAIISTILFVSLFGCIPNSKTENTLLAERISRIENGLQPNLQIQGDSIPRFNIDKRLKELGIPGVSIAIINNGELEWAKGYGLADVAENRPVTAETMFLAGSISKPVSAIRVHQLAEEGVIDLDKDINTYLSTWKIPENEFTEREKVTTRRILNHTAGLTVWGFSGYDKGDTIPSIPDILNGKGNTDPVRVYKEPGESWMYSGGGYTVMQLMMTDIEQESFPKLMEKNVLKPLGMASSTFENPLPQEYHSMAATGYRSNGEEVEGKWPIYPEMAAAGLWTTPSELILWAKEVQHIQQKKQNGILKADTVEKMLTQGMGEFGLGPQVSEHTYGHGGSDEGFKADMVVWKEHPVAVVIMVNSNNGSIMQEILLSIVEEYELPGVEPEKRSVIFQTEAQRNRFTGKYSIPSFGEVTINLKDDGLEAVAAFFENPIILLPESDSIYFNKDNGASFNFQLIEDKVVGFVYRRIIEAEKIEKED